jgi:hypothetical protein
MPVVPWAPPPEALPKKNSPARSWPTDSSAPWKPRPFDFFMLTREQALTIVLRCLTSLGRELSKPELEQANEQTHLLGDASPLDSLALVKLIVDLEEDVRVATGKSVILAEENTMDPRTSPFRRVDLLAEYVVEVTAR